MGSRLTTTVKAFLGGIPGVRQGYHAALRGLAWSAAARDFAAFRRASIHQRPELVPAWTERVLCLDDRTPQTPFDRHYVYHTAWATRQLARHRPLEHVDISSSIYFVALASAIVPIRHYDYRPPPLVLPSLEVAAADLMALPFADGSLDSLSCMHVIEHVGLGRYGDPLDPRGDIKAAAELCRALAPGGRFYFVAPVGRLKVAFNGHRIYDFATVRSLFPDLNLEEWALVPDDPLIGLIDHPAPDLIDAQHYACGCFAFRKPA